MQKGRYPNKWARNKYDGHDLPSAPYTQAENQPLEDVGRDAPSAPSVDATLPQAPPEAEVQQVQETVEHQPPPEVETQSEPQSARPYQAKAMPLQPQETGIICGKNAVLAALRADQSINRVLLAEGLTGAFATEVIKRCRALGVPYQFVPKTRLAAIAGPDHRGVACELSAFNYAEVEDMLEIAARRGEQPLLLLLDSVEDPHNLGAVIRTAFCVGAHGVIIPKRRSATLNATVAKTSAGASAYLPVARVANLSQTARALKEAGLWLAAADMDGQTAWRANLNGPLALVLGGEDKGVSPLLKQGCDFCVSLPMAGNLGSLNVSAAAAALLYEIRRQREN